MYPRYRVDDASNAESIVRPSPALARERKARRGGLIDIGEFIGLDGAVCYAGAGKEADIRHKLLLEVRGPARIFPW